MDRIFHTVQEMRWCTAVELTEIFAVTERKLQQFSTRGNLASRIAPDGVRLYAYSGVERLFPPRGSAALLPRTSNSFGTLGGLTLGAAADSENARISRLPTRVRREESQHLLASG